MVKKIFIILSLLLISLILIKNKQAPKINNKIDPNNIINDINKKNKQIKKIYADVYVDNFFIKSEGFVCYEKENNFKFIIKNKIEIGSNENFIWFWIYNLKPKSLYYCETKKLNQSRLKKIFYPNNIKRMLGICELQSNNIKIDNNEIFILEFDNDIEIITILRNNLINEYLFYEKSNLKLSIKINDYQTIENYKLPKNITLRWIEEKININLIVSNIKINEFEFKNWQIPDYGSKINISNY